MQSQRAALKKTDRSAQERDESKTCEVLKTSQVFDNHSL
jgi:hypothetical protein